MLPKTSSASGNSLGGNVASMTLAIAPGVDQTANVFAGSFSPKLTAKDSQTPAESRDQALIRRVLAGDSEAFYQLVKPYQRMLYASAISMLGNEADAEEVAQESFLKAYKHLARFRGECKFSTWLVQITINESRMRLRKYREHLYESLDAPQTNEDGEDYTPRDFADWREIPSESLEREEVRQALQDALATLDRKYSEVIVLRDVNGLSTRETAKMLGITEASVKTRLLRARLMMRDALSSGLDAFRSPATPPTSSR
jgi:RNA polymerase sigma-70 factor, ECF subfamily